MQNYIIIKPIRGPAKLTLGMIDDLPELWQRTARQLLLRRRLKLNQRLRAIRHSPDSPGGASQHTVQTAQHTQF